MCGCKLESECSETRPTRGEGVVHSKPGHFTELSSGSVLSLMQFTLFGFFLRAIPSDHYTISVKDFDNRLPGVTTCVKLFIHKFNFIKFIFLVCHLPRNRSETSL